MIGVLRLLTASLVASLLLLSVSGPAAGQTLADLAAEEVGLVELSAKAGESTWASAAFSQEATGLVVTGVSPDRAIEAWARFGDGPWRELSVVFSATDDLFYAGFHGDEVHYGGHFEVRFRTTAPIELTSAGTFDNRLDPDRSPSEGVGDGTQLDVHDGAGHVVAPYMYDRSDWQADPFRGDPTALARPDYLHMAFHHAAGFGAYTEEEAISQVKAIQDLHQNVRGWSDIGYHFVMDQSGRLYQGRPFLDGDAPLATAPALAMGAHVGGMNTGNIGVCVLGCYHPPYTATCTDVLSPSARDSLAVIYAFLSENYGVSPADLRGHRQFETASTACPGDNNMAIIEALREQVRTYLSTGNAPVGAARLTVQVDDQGVVHVAWEFLEDHGIASYRIERVQAGVSTIVYEGSGAESNAFADAGAGASESVVYRLFARAADGREQLLATVEADLGDPQHHVLTENFPDPFASTTTIRYYLPQDGLVRLVLFDVLGREVSVLDVGPRDGGRWYLVDVEADGLPAGTYFYRLEVEGFSGQVFSRTRSIVRIR